MKKTLVNALLFIGGYLLFTFAIAIVAFGFWTDWMTFNDESLPSRAPFYFGALLVEVLGIFFASVAIDTIKQAFLPGLSPMWSFKKGQLVQFVMRDKHGCAIFKVSPFTGESPLLQVRNPVYEENSPEVFHYRYYFDGKKLHSAIK